LCQLRQLVFLVYHFHMSIMTVTASTTDNELLKFIRDAISGGETVEITTSESFLTPAQVAQKLNVSRTFIMSNIKSGAIRSVKRGNRHRISLSECNRFRQTLIEEHCAMVADEVEAELFGNQ